VPFPIELVFPERVFGVIHKMVLFAVNAFEGMWARFSFLCFELGGIHFTVPFAALDQVSIVLKFVRSAAFLAFGPICLVSKRCVFPFLAVVVLGDTWVHGSISDSSNMLTKVEGPVYDSFDFGTVLGVPDVDPDNRHIQIF